MPQARRGIPRGLRFLASLEGRDSVEILDLLARDDPLGLGAYCADWLRAEGLLIDPSRLLGESLVELACEVSLDSVPQDDPTWIGSCVARAAKRILRRDAERLAHGAAESEGDDYDDYLALRDAFGLAPGTELLASVRFHDLPGEARRAFFGLIVEQRSLTAVARRLGSDPETIASLVFDGLEALGIAEEPQREPVVDGLLERDHRGGRIL